MPVLPTSGVPFDTTQLTRRGFMAAGLAGGLALAACSQSKPEASASARMAAAIAAAEAARPHSGRTVTATLTPQQVEVDLGGPVVRTLAYGSTIPGPLIRANVGDELVVTDSNRLDHPTSVHWHGIALRNDMDGAEPATPNINAGQDFTYRFSVPNSGTYWGHPHTGLDEDTGLYLPVIVDDPTEGNYDAESIVILDDWTDGVGKSPQQLYSELTSPDKTSMQNAPPTTKATPTTSTTSTSPTTTTGTASPTPTTSTSPTGSTSPAAPTTGMPAGSVGRSDLLGGDAGDISYPYYLINGRIPASPTTFSAKPGQRIRIRFINAGSDTAFRVALAGHSMTVTHTDGYPVVPKQVDALLIGMAGRYDVIVTVANGVFPLVALAEGKNALARAALHRCRQPTRSTIPTSRTHETGGHHRDVHRRNACQLGPARPQPQPPGGIGRQHGPIQLDDQRRALQQDEAAAHTAGPRPTITFDNTTTMYHPIHLHGHTFQLINADGSPGARKDTVIVLPKQKVNAILVADNPGTWLIHCHNTYHQYAGMQTLLDYVF